MDAHLAGVIIAAIIGGAVTLTAVIIKLVPARTTENVTYHKLTGQFAERLHELNDIQIALTKDVMIVRSQMQGIENQQVTLLNKMDESYTVKREDNRAIWEAIGRNTEAITKLRETCSRHETMLRLGKDKDIRSS